MAYVAVKGGEQAIDNAHAWLAEERRGDAASAGAVACPDRGSSSAARSIASMAEGSLYDRELAALAIKQAQGDLIEAAFLLRAYRTTLPRFAHSHAGRYRGDADRAPHLRHVQGSARRTGARPDLRLHASAAGFRACWTMSAPPPGSHARAAPMRPMPRVPDILGHEGLLEPDGSVGSANRAI